MSNYNIKGNCEDCGQDYQADVKLKIAVEALTKIRDETVCIDADMMFVAEDALKQIEILSK